MFAIPDSEDSYRRMAFAGVQAPSGVHLLAPSWKARDRVSLEADRGESWVPTAGTELPLDPMHMRRTEHLHHSGQGVGLLGGLSQ
jgi:hypothetical protein